MNKKKKTKILVGIVAFVMVVLMVTLGFLLVDLKYSATLDIVVAPISAEVKIDGKVYENGTYKMEPGEVAYEITKDGFATKSGVLNLEDGRTTKLYTYLLPTDGSFDWYLEHESDQMILNTIGDALAGEESRSYFERYPIVQILPIVYANYDAEWNYMEFRIDGGDFDECEKAFCVKVTDTTGGNYDVALEMIREKGFSPDDYEIIYQYEPIVPLER